MKTKNSTFSALSWIRDIKNISVTEKSIMYALASRIDKNFEAYPSRTRLARDAGIKSTTTITQSIKNLQSKGLIKSTRRFKDDGGTTSNLYQILVPPKYKPNMSAKHNMIEGSMGNESKLSNITAPNNDTSGIESHLDEEGTSYPDVLLPPTSSDIKGIWKNYMTKNISQKAMICFWWDLVAQYSPESYSSKRKLSSYQHKALVEIFKTFTDRRIPLELLEVSHCYWDTYVSSHQYYSGPINPTPVWICKHIDEFFGFAQISSKDFSLCVQENHT